MKISRANKGTDNRPLLVARAEFGLTQDQVAKKVDISRQEYSNLETGKNKNPSLTIAIRLGRVFKRDVEELFSI